MQSLCTSLVVLPMASFALLMASVAGAQSAPQPPDAGSTPASISSLPAVSGCPVGFTAQRQPGLTAMKRVNRTNSAEPDFGLQIDLNHRSAPEIESVVITVHGTSPKTMLLPAGPSSSNQISKTIELHRTEGSEGLREAAVWMKMVTVARVDLISITYANGSTWHESEGLRCQAVPSKFLLIAAEGH